MLIIIVKSAFYKFFLVLNCLQRIASYSSFGSIIVYYTNFKTMIVLKLDYIHDNPIISWHPKLNVYTTNYRKHMTLQKVIFIVEDVEITEGIFEDLLIHILD